MENKLIKFFKRDKFADFVGIRLVKVEPGHAVTEMEISEHHLNGLDIVQGGVIFTLADFAFAAAANAGGQVTVGMNANISYFKAAQGKLLVAEAREVSASRKIVNYNVHVFDEGENLIAQVNIAGYKKDEKIDFNTI